MLRRLALPALLVLAVVLSACGSSTPGRGGGGPDPAAAVPRDAFVYVEATLRPRGAARQGALAAAAKILRTRDPETRIRRLLGDGLLGHGRRVDFARDVEPWLGDRAGLWVGPPAMGGTARTASTAQDEPPVGGVIAVRDAALARQKVLALARRESERLTRRAVRGHAYQVTRDGNAFAFRNDELLTGDEVAVRRMLTLGAGAGLAGTDAYRKAIAPLDRDRLATFYMDRSRLFQAAAATNPEAGAQLGLLRSLWGPGGLRPVAASFAADADRLTIESVGPAGGSGGVSGGLAPELVKTLPGGSWAAFGAPKVGDALRRLVSQAGGAFGGAAIAGQLRREFGLDLERDLFAWMGDVGVFVRGTRAATVDGALVVQVTDEARAVAAFGKFVGLARTRAGWDARPISVPGADAAFNLGAPEAAKPVVLARGKGRMVLAYGRAAAAQALDPDQRLESSPTYAAASRALGDGIAPAALVSIPAVEALVAATGNADADWRRAKPYLDAFSVVASGAKREGNRVRSRFVAGLK